MKKIILSLIIVLSSLILCGTMVFGYPIDGYEWTGIRRLLRLHLILEGKLRGGAPLPGARKSIADIKLNLMDERGDALAQLPSVDPVLQKQIDALFPDRHESYSIAVVDITPGRSVRFAERRADRGFPPGSVGKLAIAGGLFTELKNLHPDSLEKRRALLRTRMVVADKWIMSDHHEVPIFDPESNTSAFRPAREQDVFSLYEWTDHMLSASANSAASIVWKEVILMRAFGKKYPPTPEEEKEFFEKTKKNALGDMALSGVNDPLRAVGIAQEEWHLGNFFTSEGKKRVPGSGGSMGTPIGLIKFLIAIERGVFVDQFSSLEIKRLLYMTARRIRYASSPALDKAALYFKSGSQYKCTPEINFTCGKYKGNAENYMNSVAIVEHPDGRTYMVALMSNVLRKNSAVDHQTIATQIDRILAR
ncbi:MAG: hypothetical protein ACMUIP_08610 [bacterium]